ncbi:DUF2333 family protein [Hydrocarboniclastica marina]|uniref:DUF2333 family protein n=1 Tax=Hydrocarboniclastica marina TaxID=2259620 RepID=A0A4P7XJD3_9ALTE|nr:DUF2333 family protein [Hydrocarboniclastica marina]MAL97329.1 hypothetical protein [Alteromonadaceae bacterium]QCF27229.1 DUF2333 family protein [Hydrocarboniclastica marina]|tara:strand:+ start:3030 stop:4037 length:1008 start_codon:yes stop_codon:yes gene_type:complete
MLKKLNISGRNSAGGDSGNSGTSKAIKWISALVVIYVLVVLAVGFWWDHEPDLFDVKDVTANMAQRQNDDIVVGYTTTAALVQVAETLLEKRGGYITNDVLPPGSLMDNVPNWEYGVLVQVRDMARSMRQNFSRAQTQSLEDRDLTIAEPQFNFDSASWALPATETEYRSAINALRSYMSRLSAPGADARFYARADNLRTWLSDVESRLGSLSRRLSESAGKVTTDSDGNVTEVQNAWDEIDDIFYEARGTTWALVHLLRAVEIDFRDILEKKNALVSMNQIVTELEQTQATLWSPIILNGSGFGLFANHSLSMASYISRTNASIIELRNLLSQG